MLLNPKARQFPSQSTNLALRAARIHQNPKDSCKKLSEIIEEGSRKESFQSINNSDDSESVQMISRKSRRIQKNHQESSRIVENRWESLRIVENRWESLRIIENHWESLRILPYFGLRWGWGSFSTQKEEPIAKWISATHFHQFPLIEFKF